MDELNKYLKFFFQTARPEEILSKKNTAENFLSAEEISYGLFQKYSFSEFKGRSDNEINQYYIFLKQNFKQSYNYNSLLGLLVQFGLKTLELQNDIPIVKFEHVLEWRDVTHRIDQTNVITAYLAYMSIKCGVKQDFFAWPTVLSTNNRMLQNIINKGISENHYHLHGSTQIFPISWVSIMNHPQKMKERIKNISSNLMPYTSFVEDEYREPWDKLLLEASKIRLNLFCKIHKEYKNCSINGKFFFADEIERLTTTISRSRKLRHSTDNPILDYAITNQIINNHPNCNNMVLLGERSFLFDCFLQSFLGNFSNEDNDLLYKYILIKNNFRAELIQCNSRVGFKNFAHYQDRKNYFIYGIKEYEEEALRLSLNEALTSNNILSLEARIMVNKNPDSLYKEILYYDNIYKDSNSEYDKHKDKLPFFFVLHYPKNTTPLNKESFVPRNAKQRANNKKYSLSAIDLINHLKCTENRIYGIDTCSNEIGCRPEVFATDYRLLRNFTYKESISKFYCNYQRINIGRTYHVGEDFLDITDGLRAIDEVIRYLNFSFGDRLGHALALGIKPSEFYEFKEMRILIPKQDLLDNFVWIYNKSNEMNIIIEPVLKQFFESHIHEYAYEIYGDFFKSLGQSFLYTYPEVLYDAWKLRGDNPELYINMTFKHNLYPMSEYEKAMFVDDDELNNLRKRKEICQLYYAYHYENGVKENGMQLVAFDITPEYISLVEKLQKKMQFYVAQKGIMIECNPSSNCLIGTFKEYSKHPITTFNNLHLEKNLSEIHNCPQISVSINTDDQGVFDTSLENEYALIAAGLAEIKSESGERKYSDMEIYEYLDNVRQMGNIQSFMSFSKSSIQKGYSKINEILNS